jgi:ribonuclease D
MTQNKNNIQVFADDLPSEIELTQVISIDCEAMGLCINRDRICLVQIADSNGKVYVIKFSAGNYNAPNLSKILADKSILKIFHYARFDVALMYRYLGTMTENIYCTKIASRIARTYTDSHGLKDLCRDLLGITLNKTQQSSDWGNDKLSDEQIKYAASDVVYLFDLKKSLDIILKRESRTELALGCFNFIKQRALLDIMGWEDLDIFAH